jgi:SAM-dependent methyltransferase
LIVQLQDDPAPVPAFTPWQDLRVAADGARIAELEEARRRAACPLAAIERWSIDELLRRPVTAEAPATFEEMMPLWVGGRALREAAPERREEYASFLDRFGAGQRFREILAEIAEDRGAALECDLGPAHDFVLIERYLGALPARPGPLLVLEIGGGYGRLAEIFHRYSQRPVCCLLTDGIPESIWFSWAYLRARLPDARVGAQFNGDPFDPQSQDFYVTPSWELPGQATTPLDLAVNIASLQEMPDAAVGAYLALIDARMRPGGLVFLENSREFFYRREYRYPDRWRYLVKQHSPRSRTLDYPLELLEVTGVDQTAANREIVESYYVAMKDRALGMIEAQQAELAAQRAALVTLRHEQARRLREDREKHRKAVATLQARIAALQGQIAALRDQSAALRDQSAALRRDLAQARADRAALRDQGAALRRDLAQARADGAVRIKALREALGALRRLHVARMGDLRDRHRQAVVRLRARLAARRPSPPP